MIFIANIIIQKKQRKVKGENLLKPIKTAQQKNQSEKNFSNKINIRK